MQFSTIFLFASTALAAALPQPVAEANPEAAPLAAPEAEPQWGQPQYTPGTCSPYTGQCYLQWGGQVACDPNARCSRPGGACTFSSSNSPGGSFATGKANCT